MNTFTKQIVAGAVALGLALIVLLLLKSRTPDETPIRFAYQNRVGSAACIIAVENDLFTPEGLTIEPFRFNSGPACAEALYSGSADIATMGDTTAIITVARDERFAIIASHGQGENRHRLMVAPDSPLTAVADLKGKTVGVKKGTSTYGGLLLLLDHEHIDPAEIRLIDMRPDEMPDALAAGSIDAFVASEPTPSLAEQRGAKQLTTLGGLGNTYPLLILARRDWLAAHPEQAAAFLRVLQKAEHTITTDPEKTAATLAAITGLTPEVARAAMARHRYTLTLDETITNSLRQTAAFLQSQGTIETPPDFTTAATGRYLP